MELVGKTVQKQFLGLGSISGVIDSYDASAGYFSILYGDGASEEVDVDEIASILRGMGHEPPTGTFMPRTNRGRSRKKRCRLDLGDGRQVSAEAYANGLCIDSSWLGGIFHMDELGGNAAHECNGRMDMSSVDDLKENVSLDGSEVAEARMGEISPDICTAGQRQNEDLGGEGILVDLESKYEGSQRKRRKISGQPKPSPDMPLRRSTRRPTTTMLSPPDNFILNNEPAFEDPENNGTNSESGADESNSKSTLPPSSKDLDVDGLPVLHLFSVYSCLRSFSRSLFLSPFRLETFVAALKCKYANPLIDSIHFSLLHALKPHLKLLMEEGLQPATNCLRNLNWDMLDLVTWPIFLVEYMLFCGSAMRKDIKLVNLKLLDAEYYEQPAEVKLEILHCLCDDAVQVECLRSAFNRRVTDLELTLYSNNNMYYLRKQNYSAKRDGECSLAQEGIDDIADGNSDECCLCKMDGNLICCDGCPAAFHSRCVGMVKNHLPDGDWYCPECLVDKNGIVSFFMPFKGADFLGRDSHGRLYSGCCGYLLVFDSCDSNHFCHYYNKNDLSSVISFLKSEPSFNVVRNAIAGYWGIPIEDSYGAESSVPVIGGSKSCDISFSAQQNSVISIQDEEFAVSGTVGGKPDGTSFAHISQLNNSFEVSLKSSIEVASVKPNEQTVGFDETILDPRWSCNSQKMKGVIFQVQSDPFSYVNYYTFGQVAAAMAEELFKSSEINNTESSISDEVIKSDQLKVICKKFSQWCWYNYYNLMVETQKEGCGWCFACRSSNDAECLFKVVNEKHLEGIKFNLDDSTNLTCVDSERNKKSHILFAIHHILSIEDRVRSFLSGPWEKPHYSTQWRRAILEAIDVNSLKFLLLSLESNLRCVSFSAEWLKPVDSDQTVGSPSFESTRSHWWRGGKLSRKLFCWKMLPRFVASKYGRQAGHKKIPNLFYHDGLEFAKRSKSIAWRVAVEMSETVAQLIYQVKDLDSSIKWAEIFSTHIFSQCTKESKKVEKQFKYVLVRKKCVEGTELKYLLDFGKRETIPATVTKYGVLFEESSDERKRFWLSEAHVPLNLIRAFEERKLSRLIKKTNSGVISEKRSIFIKKKTKKFKGLSYLLTKVRNSEKHYCGYCNKDMLLREAVSCCYCDGLFHRKHFRVPKGAMETPTSCFKCKEKENVKASPFQNIAAGWKRKTSVSRKGIRVSMSKKSNESVDFFGENVKDNRILVIKKSKENKLSICKKAFLAKSKESKQFMAKKLSENKVSLARRSKKIIVSMAGQCRKNPVRLARKVKQNIFSLARKSKLNHTQAKEKVTNKRKRKTDQDKGHSISSKKAMPLKSDNFVNWSKKKRSVLFHSHWLNGLLWVSSPSNERGRTFREKNVFLQFQPTDDGSAQLMCCLCHGDYKTGDIFLSCESCRDWFHGEAFGLQLESVSNVAGFKCPHCRNRNVPVCPFTKNQTNGTVIIKKGYNAVSVPGDIQHYKRTRKFQNASCKYCLSSAPCKNHSKVIEVPSHCEDYIVLSNKTFSTRSSTVHLSGHEQANADSLVKRIYSK